MSDKVKQQYNEWIYPLPIDDMAEAIAAGYWETGDPTYYWPLMWPELQRAPERLNILSAGCGTNQAAYYALRNPNWNVVGIDLSEASLRHQEFLKAKHGLSNLQLHQLNINDIGKLGKYFDFITCTGVLHHLPDPDLGLRSLRSVLQPDGIMHLMVYGQSLRLGVYMLQEAFRLLRLNQTNEDIKLVRDVIASLPGNHVARRYTDSATDLHYDAGVVDTFLHPQDRAYWVKDVYSFTRRSGLEFLGWLDAAVYSPEAQIPMGHPVWKKLAGLPTENAEHICDLLLQNTAVHRWFACHPEYANRIKLPFDEDAILDYIISLRLQTVVVKPADVTQKQSAELRRGNLSFQLDYRIAHLISIMDGTISIRSALKKSDLLPTGECETLSLIRTQVRSLYEMGHIYFTRPVPKP